MWGDAEHICASFTCGTPWSVLGFLYSYWLCRRWDCLGTTESLSLRFLPALSLTLLFPPGWGSPWTLLFRFGSQWSQLPKDAYYRVWPLTRASQAGQFQQSWNYRINCWEPGFDSLNADPRASPSWTKLLFPILVQTLDSWSLALP